VSRDVIALLTSAPDTFDLGIGMLAAGPHLGVLTDGSGLLHLCDDDGRQLVAVEGPFELPVPAEAARLLGTELDEVEGPLWWAGLRAPVSWPEAGAAAQRFARELVAERGGRVLDPPAWEGRLPATLPHGGARFGGSAEAGARLAPRPDGKPANPPLVDVLTERAAVVVTQRPLVWLDEWLYDAAGRYLSAGRLLQIVTAPGARLTMPLRLLADLPGLTWVVAGPGGYYDGTGGGRLVCNGLAFAPAAGATGVAPAFGLDLAKSRLTEGREPLASAPGRQVVVTAHLRHPADHATRLGTAADRVFVALTGDPPDRFGRGEPMDHAWQAGTLTDLARERAPATACFVVGGPGVLGTVRVERGRSGVDEHLTVAVGHTGEDELDGLAASLAARLSDDLAGSGRLVSLLVQVQPGRADLTVEPRWAGVAIPVGFALGPAALDEIGRARALDVGPPGTRMVGAASRPAVWFPLDDRDGSWSPAGWETFRHLVGRLRTAGTLA
jgi:hypothetical protein